MAGEITLLIYFIILSVKVSAQEKKQQKHSEEIESSRIIELETQIKYLQDQLKKTKASYSVTEIGLQGLQEKKSYLSEELRKQKESYVVGKAELDQLRKENPELKDKLASKEQELEKMLSQRSALERGLAEKNGLLQLLEKQNKEMSVKMNDLESQIERLKKKSEVQGSMLGEYVKEEEASEVIEEKETKRQAQLELTREQNKKKIGEILLANNFITKDILDKALEYQKEFGGAITQYLLAYGYLDEDKLAQCLCTQFSIPYLPLSSYEIPYEIIKLVPVDLVEKYWLVPVDRIENVLMVVMADPLDAKAIQEVEDITGCKVQVFLGLLSEIIEALGDYYKVIVKGGGLKGKRAMPFFIDTKTYKGLERRQSIRYKAKIDVNFIEPDRYKTTKTKDISRDGFSFECENPIPIGSVITLQINLPKELSPLPIAAVVQVARSIPLENNKFEIGTKLMKISEEELNTILKYASSNKEEKP